MSINISLANQKGGTGKTATTYNLAVAKAKAGKRVLMIDMDSQATLTDNVGMIIDDEQLDGLNSCKLFDKDVNPFDCCFRVSSTKFDNLFIIPSSLYLASLEFKLSYEIVMTNMTKFETFKKHIKKLGTFFDYIFFDCLPSLGPLLVCSLIASDLVVIPVIPDRSSTLGIPQLLETIESVQSNTNKKLRVAGIVPTRYRSVVKEHNEYLEHLKTEYPKYPTLGVIPESAIVTKEFSYGRCCVDAHPTSTAAKEYTRIATKL